ncbi:hypothetical protein CHUAL_013118 [Chamberlinius hualienensis]
MVLYLETNLKLQMQEVSFVDGHLSVQRVNDKPLFVKGFHSGKRSHHIVDMSTHVEESREYRKLFNDFFLSTTIHGCNQLGRPNHLFRKIFWFVVFVIGIAMAIYQSGSLINEYRRYVVIERTDRKNEWEVPFPSVTACVNNPIRWTTNITDAIGLQVVVNTINKFNGVPESAQTELANDFSDREQILLEELSHLSESERFSIGFSKEDYVLYCTFGSIDCIDILFEFNDLYYGNCVTFNPGFSSETVISTPKTITLNLLFRSNFDEAFPYLRRDRGVVVLIHSPGSAPSLNRRLTQPIYPKRWVKYGVSQIVNKRLPSPYSSKCVDARDIDVQKTLVHYKESRPYIYTMDACLDSCLQKLAMRYCNCVLPEIPFPDNHHQTLCPYTGCGFIHDAKQYSQCKCKQACREVSYNTVIYTDDRWLEQDIWVDWVNRSAQGSHIKDVDMMKTCGIEVLFYSDEVVYITEEPKVMWADFLGSIGGNVGLWVGLSVLSILELFELLFQLFTKGLQSIANLLKKQH